MKTSQNGFAIHLRDRHAAPRAVLSSILFRISRSCPAAPNRPIFTTPPPPQILSPRFSFGKIYRSATSIKNEAYVGWAYALECETSAMAPAAFGIQQQPPSPGPSSASVDRPTCPSHVLFWSNPVVYFGLSLNVFHVPIQTEAAELCFLSGEKTGSRNRERTGTAIKSAVTC